MYFYSCSFHGNNAVVSDAEVHIKLEFQPYQSSKRNLTTSFSQNVKRNEKLGHYTMTTFSVPVAFQFRFEWEAGESSLHSDRPLE